MLIYRRTHISEVNPLFLSEFRSNVIFKNTFQQGYHVKISYPARASISICLRVLFLSQKETAKLQSQSARQAGFWLSGNWRLVSLRLGQMKRVLTLQAGHTVSPLGRNTICSSPIPGTEVILWTLGSYAGLHAAALWVGSPTDSAGRHAAALWVGSPTVSLQDGMLLHCG